MSFIHHYFSQNDYQDSDHQTSEFLGIRGSEMMEAAKLELPIIPGFVIDTSTTQKIATGEDITPLLKEGIKGIEFNFPRQYGDSQNPLFLKACFSSDIYLSNLPSIHHIGLNNQTIIQFAEATDECFAYSAYRDFFKNVGIKILGIPEQQFIDMAGSIGDSKNILDIKSLVDLYHGLVEDQLPMDNYGQLIAIIQGGIKQFYSTQKNSDVNLSVTIQAMVYGNYGADSFSGHFSTRNCITGRNQIEGKFSAKTYQVISDKGKNIKKLPQPYYDELKEMAIVIEKYFKEIREVQFAIESGYLWLIEQKRSDHKTAEADLKTLLDL